MVRRSALFVLLVVLLSGCDVALWKMNERSGSTAIDSARDHDGRLSNVGLGEPGVEASAYRFNGSSSIVRVPHASDLNPGSKGFSYGAWVKFLGVPPPETWDVIRKGLNSDRGGYYKLELQNIGGAAKARCYVEGSSGSESVTGSTSINDGRWHQVTCTRRNGVVTLTIDSNTRSVNGSTGTIANSSELTIGAKPTGDDYFAGLIDLARVSVD